MKIRKPTAPDIVLFLLCLMYFLTYIDRVNVSTAAGSIKKEFGFSNTQLGLIFSGFAYPYALFQVIGGWVGDRLGRARDRSPLADVLPDRARLRRRRHFSHGDASDAELDARGQTRLRPGRDALLRAARQRGDAAHRGGADDLAELARGVRGAGRGEPRLGH